MLKEKPLEVTTCAACGSKVSLVQINSSSLMVESSAFTLGGSFILLEYHRCPIQERTSSRAGANPITPREDSR